MKRKSKSKKNEKKLNPKYIGIVLVILLIFGIAWVKSQNNAEMQIVYTFEECVKSDGSLVTDTYPQQCKTKDKTTYIQEIKKPVDTKNWNMFNEVAGFSFLCPPSWKCSKFEDDSAIVYQNHYLDIFTFQFNLITPANFQQSFLRNPNYSNPAAWYKDVLAENKLALLAPSSTRTYRPGTDGYSDPVYVKFEFSKMEKIDTEMGEALVFSASGNNPDTDIIIPVNGANLLLITLSPGHLYKDPIIREIIKSTKAN